MNIYNWLKENSKERPNKICIEDAGQEMTFSELHRLTCSFGRALQKAGIKNGDRVAVILPNIPEFIISYMAIVGIGAIVVPINPEYTAREINTIVIDARPEVLILEHQKWSNINEVGNNKSFKSIITTGLGGTFNQWINSSRTEELSSDTNLNDVAAILYTPGKRWYPMGAMLTHGNLVHNSALCHTLCNANHEDTALGLIPLYHAYGASQNMLFVLRYGGTIYLMKSMDIDELNYILTERKITILCAVPKVYYGLARHPKFKGIDYTHMSAVISGGDKLPIESYRLFKNQFNVDIRQGYGLTEAGPVCAYNYKGFVLNPESIGPPVPDVHVKVVDEDGNSLPPGKSGELLFKGPNIMKGYYNREEETREVIRDGWLYTGDLGYRDKNGHLFISGLHKKLFISSGLNVYPKEVEQVLHLMPGIKDVAVIGMPDFVAGSVGMAFIVCIGTKIKDDNIKEFARKYLAPYKIPKKIEFVDEIPRDNKGDMLIDEVC